MFDPKSLLDMLVRGGGGSAPQGGAQGGGGGGLGDLLGQLAQGGQQRGGGQAGGGLDDLLRQVLPGQGGGAGASGGGGGLGDLLRNIAPGQSGPQGGGGAGGGLGDLLGQLQKQMGAPGAAPSGSGTGGGGLMDILGQILGQATTGAKEGAQRIDDATGASGHLRDALGKATGQSPEELMGKLKELVKNNQLATGAAAGGLGAVVLGTQTGRSLAGTALKIGGLALIGGLAYKALQNYQAGKPLLTGSETLALSEAPSGSGYEASAVTDEAAMLYIRTMIASAAADGRLDAKEQERILGGLQQAGLDREAEDFLANEINNPTSIEDLAAAVQNDEEAVQVFTAARITVDLDSQEEHDFLVKLATALGLENELVAHIDATARAAA